MDKDYYAHPTAVIDEPCSIGSGTKIWHFSHIMANCRIGERCVIGQNVVVAPACVIGNGVKIQNNVSVYTGVVVEDDVFLGPSAVFTNVINPRAYIERKHEFRTTTVRRGASIGANATILCGITLGAYALIGAGAVVTRDAPAYGTLYGNPARLRGWTCWCGVPLELGTDPAQSERAACNACGRQYERAGLVVREL
jgi:UDP-2-acetamido-3-amino-2,3-dideoxy-glucuronate N-acetyltransferase